MLPLALLPQSAGRAMATQPGPSQATNAACRQHQDSRLLRGSGPSWGKAVKGEQPLLAASISGVGTGSLLKPFTREDDTRHNGPGIMKSSIGHIPSCTEPAGGQEEVHRDLLLPGAPLPPRLSWRSWSLW